MLVVAGWLIVRAGANAWQLALLVVGYALLQFVIVVLAVPILIAEALLLLSLVFRSGGSAESRRIGGRGQGDGEQRSAHVDRPVSE